MASPSSARQGAAIAVHYYAAHGPPDDTVAEITHFGSTVSAVEADLRDVEACRRVVHESVDALGGLDILVNNAGLSTACRFQDLTQRAYDDLFAVNVKAYFFLAQAAAPHLSRAGHGSIVNIASIHAHAGLPGYTAYAAYAAYAATRSHHRVHPGCRDRAGTRRNSRQCCGPRDRRASPLLQHSGYTHEFGCSVVPVGPVGTPADIGASVAFVVSDAATYITGQTFYVDGGTTARMGLWWNLDDASANG